MKRWFINLAAAVSLVLFFATVALWAAGPWNGSREQMLVGRWGFVTSSGSFKNANPARCFQIVIYHDLRTPVVGPICPLGSTPQWDAWCRRYHPYVDYWPASNLAFQYKPTLGVDAARHAWMTGNTILLIIPYWLLSLLTLLLPGLVFLPRLFQCRQRDPEVRPCSNCGYDLRATPERCPECGTVVHH